MTNRVAKWGSSETKTNASCSCFPLFHVQKKFKRERERPLGLLSGRFVRVSNTKNRLPREMTDLSYPMHVFELLPESENQTLTDNIDG